MQFKVFNRRIVDLLEVLGSVGGLKEFIVICGSVLVNYWASRMFTSKIVKKVF